MITARIKQVCKSRDIKTAYQLQKAAGFTPTLAYSLFNHTFKGMSLKTLNKLCLTLNCAPNDILKVGAKQ
jgi:DNA-binding Xre family transcriptional regulator